MEEIKKRCRFCEKEHFGSQRVCRQCIERETKIEYRMINFLSPLRISAGSDLLFLKKEQTRRLRPVKFVKWAELTNN